MAATDEGATATVATSSDDESEQWVEKTLALLTLAEKASLCAGSGPWTTMSIDRVGVPSMKVTDGPNGARGDAVSGATAACFPVGSALGATWNPDLLEEIGTALATEARSKGAQILLGPTVNLHRSPLGGRNFECYSEDPLLTAHLAAGFIRGLQANGVGACIKHYVGNESEYQRMAISSEIPERALRELYLLPFEHTVATVEPWSIMGAYNRVAGEHACANDRLLNQILKGEWAYTGLVISDWGAVHDTAASGNGGCDLEMPGPARHFGPALADAVERGEVSPVALDDKARRVLRTLWRSGQVTRPVPFEESSADRAEDRELIRRAASQSMVLLTNHPDAHGTTVLPLDPDSDITIAVIGPNAEAAAIMGGGSSIVRAHHQVHPLGALRERFGSERVTHSSGGAIHRFLPPPEPRLFAGDPDGRGFSIDYVDTDDISAEPSPVPDSKRFGSRAVRGVSWVWWLPPAGVPASGRWGARWSATFCPDTDGEWSFGAAAVGLSRVLLDGELVCDNWTDPRPGDLYFGQGSSEVRGHVTLTAGTEHDLVIEYQFPATEERAAIRFGILAPEPVDPILEAVSIARDTTCAIVVAGTNGDWETEGSDRVSMHLPGRQDELIAAVAAVNPRTVVVLNTGSPVEMPWLDDVPAVLQAWFGGQEFGDALVDVLTGAADPGGRLPTTFPARYEDNPTITNYPGELGRVDYGENIYVGYRYYSTFGPAPLFEFGHGLSYTSFAFGDVTVRPDPHDPHRLSVTVPVTNTGDRAGSTVVQLYVHPPEGKLARPAHELKAFGKVALQAGETVPVTLELDHRSFAHFDPSVPGWVSEAGPHELLIGTSSASIAAVIPIELASRVVVPVARPHTSTQEVP